MAHVAPAVDDLGPLTADRRRARASSRLRRQGYRGASSPPRSTVPTADRSPTAGFNEVDRLHLLRHDLGDLVPTAALAGVDLRRGPAP